MNQAMQDSKHNNNKAVEMIEEIARVITVGNGYAEILPPTGGGCSSCNQASSCASSTKTFNLFTGDKNTPRTIRVQNPVAAKPGDDVVIGVRANTILKGSILAYLLPLLSLLLFSVLGMSLFAWLDMNREIGSILGGIAGLFLGFKWVSAHMTSAHAAAYYEAIILRVKEPGYERVLFAQPGSPSA